MIQHGDILALLPDAPETEFFETLIARDGVKIERIVSNGQSTPEGMWYDQPWHEWVLLLTGEALLRLDNEPAPRRLLPGQWLMLPARCRHRVEWTVPGQETIWLALHWPLEMRKEEV